MKTPKQRLLVLLAIPALFAVVMLIPSCSKDDDSSPYVCETCHDTPDALAANDAKASGIYKGVVVGSTGYISLDIQNGSSAITATIKLDGITAVLTSSITVVDGENYVAPFTGTFNGSPVTMTFQVAFNGSDPIILTSDIPGHPNATFEIYKETSTSLIEAFEGSYNAGADGSGTFNIVTARSVSVWGYIAKDGSNNEINTGEGTFDASGHLLNEEGDNVATITNDVLHGTSTTSSGETLTLNGNRTL